MRVFKKPIEFEWDKGNDGKNWLKHHVTSAEIEEVFLDPHKFSHSDFFHSQLERRWILLGKTKKGRLLFIVYTLRGQKIRVTSARDMNQGKDGYLYEKTT